MTRTLSRSPILAKPKKDQTRVENDSTDPSNWLQRFTRKRFIRWLDGLKNGRVDLHDAEIGRKRFGVTCNDGLQASWRILHPNFYSRLATRGSIGVAESYLQGEWKTDDLTSLLRILCRNLELTRSADSGMASIAFHVRRLLYALKPNSLTGSRRHIAAHYDLSNEFFELFLDPTLMYSCAYFEHPQATLHEASLAKIERICTKLELQPQDQVLEIGTGWGGFAIHAAEQFGSHLTTTTISQAQYKKAAHRIVDANVGDRIKLLDCDYRQLSGQYDKLVSIEMIEAVGERHLKQFFQQCNSLLKPGGRMVLQAIVMPEQRYELYRRGVDFIRQYIFPGGFLPSVAVIQQAVGETGDLRLDSVEDLTPHYALTLNKWYRQFNENLMAVRKLGFDDRFVRMWEYYLCYCEAAFREQTVRVVQIAWDKTSY